MSWVNLRSRKERRYRSASIGIKRMSIYTEKLAKCSSSPTPVRMESNLAKNLLLV